ncbi:hypothetical protein DN051_40500 [Streptomyces cadmiisoli]|uniref:Helix-turn-helix domain-containing protein n=1 Tax=Streptomyces cadmiisoli TaxID=2184053 RepID=A0A2Z4IRQ6_9ACTN|nr:hypothetical protein [Streptomyces cadmiisoli]AWW35339.1 hypothetical protein DN051_00310 [Streptomyces cadmiisoli]AWW42101.1 hypothetical protein DN051_40500 [Streptomyces cadmiisoli]
MTGFGVGVRRGVMAADRSTRSARSAPSARFTQVANALFRDCGLSFRAKGIFGFLSTHVVGWRVTVADLVGVGPDGRDAVRAGVSELERFGYLVREQVRCDDGTLGGIVYSITDRPALRNAGLTQATSWPSVSVSGSSSRAGAGSEAGIRRGVMAADRFTQIANGLFRDPRLSFKAQGLFGLISTHRDGWRISVADLARRGRDGEAAVRSGLKELEKHGFLRRGRERRPDGTLGAATYVLTDLPGQQRGRSQPMSGFPPVGDPTSADHLTKNTIGKNTTKQKTTPLRPCARGHAATHAATGKPVPAASAPPGPRADAMHPGIRLLLDIGARCPDLLLTGQVLTDQGRVITAMMEAGWNTEQLRHVITHRPLPDRVRTTVGAIIAARLRAAHAYPPPPLADSRHHDGDAPGDEATAGPVSERSSPAPPSRTVVAALAYRALVECSGCGAPATAPGESLCPSCLGWPLCRTCPGPTPRRAHPDNNGRCNACVTAQAVLLAGSRS